jgi:WD40 repeat protein
VSLSLVSGVLYGLSTLLSFLRCTTMQVYDLAWSPTGEYIIAGSTDNCARVYTAVDGISLYMSQNATQNV